MADRKDDLIHIRWSKQDKDKLLKRVESAGYTISEVMRMFGDRLNEIPDKQFADFIHTLSIMESAHKLSGDSKYKEELNKITRELIVKLL